MHRADEVSISNEHLRVDVDRSDGTYAIETSDGNELSGLGRLVDGGDGGDTYNHSPPAIDRIVDAPDRVRISAVETGPVRARLRIETDYTVAAFAVGDDVSCSERSERSEAVTVGTILELRPGERFVRITHEFDNRARPPPPRAFSRSPPRSTARTPSARSPSSTAGLVAEGGAHEYGLPTFPSRRFVDASDGEFGVALAARRPARVRGRRRRPRARPHVAAGDRLVVRSSRRCDRTRPVRRWRCTAQADARRATRASTR